MSTNNKSIQILRGDKSSLSDDLKKTKLEPGQPFFDKNAKTLQIGDGSGIIGDNVPGNDGSNLTTAPYVTVKDGAVTTSKLADASNDESNPTGITTEKIENSAVTSGKLKRTDVYVMHQLLCEDNDTNRDARYTASSLQFVDHNKKYKPGAGSKFVSSRLSLMPNETVAGGFTLKMPWVSGTLATKEQVENGEIIAQTSQNATNATYAQYASEDTTKGTIEERLNRLGFKEGYFTLTSGSMWGIYNAPQTTQLKVTREGNYVHIPINLTKTWDDSSYYHILKSANDEWTDGSVIGQVDDDFIPDKDEYFLCYAIRDADGTLLAGTVRAVMLRICGKEYANKGKIVVQSFPTNLSSTQSYDFAFPIAYPGYDQYRGGFESKYIAPIISYKSTVE